MAASSSTWRPGCPSIDSKWPLVTRLLGLGRLVKNDAARVKHAKRREMDAPGDEDRHRVDGGAFLQEFGDFLALGIQPLADILCFEADKNCLGGHGDEIEFALHGVAADRAGRFDLRIERVVGTVEPAVAAEKSELGLRAQRAVDGDFECLADAVSQALVLAMQRYQLSQ